MAGWKRYLLYLSFAGLGGLIVAATEFWPTGQLLSRYGPNAATGLMGVSLTLLIVERIVRWERRSSLAPLRERAKRRLGQGVYDLLLLLAQMYKAAAPPDSETYDDMPSLIDGWLREVPRLNFCAPAPSANQVWFEYASQHAQLVFSELDPPLDRYGEALGTEIVVAVEDVLTNHFYNHCLLKAVHVLLRDNQEGRERTEYMPFGAGNPMSVKARAEFAERLKTLYLAYEQLDGKPIKVPEIIWTHVAPDWGSARFGGQLTPHNAPPISDQLPSP